MVSLDVALAFQPPASRLYIPFFLENLSNDKEAGI